jgi:hypothetical protein
MMRKYLKESLHWLDLALFKPITLRAETHGLTKKQVLRVYLKVLPVQLTIVLTVVSFFGTLCKVARYPFHLAEALAVSVFYGLFEGLFVGLLVGTLFGPFARLTRVLILRPVGAVSEIGATVGDWLLGGLIGGVGGGLGVGLLGARLGMSGFGFFFGVNIVLIVGIIVRPTGKWFVGLMLGLVFGLGGLFLLGLDRGPFKLYEWFDESDNRLMSLRFGTAYAVVFLFGYFRPFFLLPYAVQLWRSRKAADPFPLFDNSPVYWDEAIAMPLPFLADWLVRLSEFDRQRGMTEITNVARRPYQRRAAQRALVRVLFHDLEKADSFKKMASALDLLAILPSDAQYLPTGLDDAARHILKVAELASDYLTRVTTVGQINVLGELRGVVESFRDAMVLVKPPVGPTFQSAASHWLEIVKAEEIRVRERIAFEPIPNPFVVGNPLMVRDHRLFKGRKDIIVAIEENIINPAQRPALLLYGRRRIGKTSTLLNLPRLLSSRFVPVFIDCQDAKWREGDEAFCYQLAVSIHDALNQRSLVETARRPKLEQFERYAFTRLGEYLDQIEESSRSTRKQILLTFDEYEKLEEGIGASKVTTEVLNQLRTIVQHRERIVVLFSGGHRFEEMKIINWSDYLINVKTLELSFLEPEDARELITEPVPLLQYESGVIEQIIEMSHCQPYLLQAVASDLVNYLNSERRMLASAADLEVAVEKVLVTAQAYFFYTWTGDCTEGEREVLRMIAIGDTNSRNLAERQPSLQSLCHKEILERQPSGYRFSIELFRRWVLKNQTAQPFDPGDLQEPADLEYADLLTSHT